LAVFSHEYGQIEAYHDTHSEHRSSGYPCCSQVQITIRVVMSWRGSWAMRMSRGETSVPMCGAATPPPRFDNLVDCCMCNHPHPDHPLAHTPNAQYPCIAYCIQSLTCDRMRASLDCIQYADHSSIIIYLLRSAYCIQSRQRGIHQ
jgi:hypothetical protein